MNVYFFHCSHFTWMKIILLQRFIPTIILWILSISSIYTTKNWKSTRNFYLYLNSCRFLVHSENIRTSSNTRQKWIAVTSINGRIMQYKNSNKIVYFSTDRPYFVDFWWIFVERFQIVRNYEIATFKNTLLLQLTNTMSFSYVLFHYWWCRIHSIKCFKIISQAASTKVWMTLHAARQSAYVRSSMKFVLKKLTFGLCLYAFYSNRCFRRLVSIMYRKQMFSLEMRMCQGDDRLSEVRIWKQS